MLNFGWLMSQEIIDPCFHSIPYMNHDEYGYSNYHNPLVSGNNMVFIFGGDGLWHYKKQKWYKYTYELYNNIMCNKMPVSEYTKRKKVFLEMSHKKYSDTMINYCYQRPVEINIDSSYDYIFNNIIDHPLADTISCISAITLPVSNPPSLSFLALKLDGNLIPGDTICFTFRYAMQKYNNDLSKATDSLEYSRNDSINIFFPLIFSARDIYKLYKKSNTKREYPDLLSDNRLKGNNPQLFYIDYLPYKDGWTSRKICFVVNKKQKEHDWLVIYLQGLSVTILPFEYKCFY